MWKANWNTSVNGYKQVGIKKTIKGINTLQKLELTWKQAQNIFFIDNWIKYMFNIGQANIYI